MARKSIRKLVALTPDTLAAIERFRRSEEMQEVRCQCGHIVGKRDDLPSESETLRRLIEIGLDARDAG